MSGAHDNRRLPALGAVARAQARLIVGRKPRGMWIALAIIAAQIIAAATGGILFGVTIQSGHDQPTRLFFSKVSDFSGELGFAIDEGAVAVIVAAIATFIWAFIWPFRVWREEMPQQRGYHWAMPMDRRRHDLLRVGVGLALLPIVTAVLVLLAVVIAVLSGHAAVFPSWGGLFWVNLFASPLLIYLMVSIPVVGSRHPSAWVWGTLGAGVALTSLLHAFGLISLSQPMRGVLLGSGGLLTTLGGALVSEFAGWGSRAVGPWALAWLFWLAIAVTGVWLAASRRHRSI
jgi:hypothetical protein